MDTSQGNADADESVSARDECNANLNAESSTGAVTGGGLDVVYQRACQEYSQINKDLGRLSTGICNDLNGNADPCIRPDVNVNITELNLNADAETVAVNSANPDHTAATTVVNISSVDRNFESADLNQTYNVHNTNQSNPSNDLHINCEDREPSAGIGCDNSSSTASSNRLPSYAEAITAMYTSPPKYEDVVPECRTVVRPSAPQAHQPRRQGYCNSPKWRFATAAAMLAFVMVVLVIALFYKTRQ